MQTKRNRRLTALATVLVAMTGAFLIPMVAASSVGASPTTLTAAPATFEPTVTAGAPDCVGTSCSVVYTANSTGTTITAGAFLYAVSPNASTIQFNGVAPGKFTFRVTPGQATVFTETGIPCTATSFATDIPLSIDLWQHDAGTVDVTVSGSLPGSCTTPPPTTTPPVTTTTPTTTVPAAPPVASPPVASAPVTSTPAPQQQPVIVIAGETM